MIKRQTRPPRKKHENYDLNVFINCPFDDQFKPLLQAIAFAIHSCGFVARCAQEDSAQNVRFTRILDIIGECRFGIHDLSRINLEADVMPRNNMPLELGVFIGTQRFGTPYDYEKEYLVLDSIPHRYKEHITDLGGEDPSIHKNDPAEVIRCVREWLKPRARQSEQKMIASPSILFEQLELFQQEAPEICERRSLRFTELTFSEYTEILTEWLDEKRKLVKDLDDIVHGYKL